MLREDFLAALKKVDFIKVARFCLLAFMIILPFQIRTMIFNSSYLLTGNFNEYTTFFLYGADILIISAFVFFGVAVFKGEYKKNICFGDTYLSLIVLVLVLSMMTGVFFAESKLLSFFILFRYFELLLFYFLLVNGVLSKKQVLSFFAYAMLMQAFIAIEQYLLQSSVGFRFLGEPIISPAVEGVAKIDMGDFMVMRAYGTFLHPNILAGLLSVCLIWSYYVFRKNLWLFLLIGSVLLLALILTFSRSAFIALGGAILMYYAVSNKKFPLKKIAFWSVIFLFFITIFNLESLFLSRFLMGLDASTLERMQYLSIGKNMLFENPMGVGMGHFTLNMQDYLSVKLAPWVMQPVHNLYLLIANEAGLITVIIFLFLLGYIFWGLLKSADNASNQEDNEFAYLQIAVFTLLIILFLFDHYFYTSYQGQVFLFIYFALCSSLIRRSLLPSRKS